MIFVAGLSNGGHFAKRLCRQKGFGELKYLQSFFPDGEHYLRFPENVKGKEIVLAQSMFPFPNNALVELFLAAKNAKELGAKKVTGLLPYIGYMRQDRRFNKGEAFSAKHVAELLSGCLDEVFTFDGHFHRIKKPSEIFSVPAHNLHSAPAISGFVEKNFPEKNTVLVGPDSESSQWAKKIADTIGFESSILSKTRLGSRKVIVRLPKNTAFENKDVLIIDDIVSTGNTVISAAKEIRKKKPRSISLVCVHALFVENALERIKKSGVKKVYSTNTVLHKTNRIDLSGIAAKEIFRRVRKK